MAYEPEKKAKFDHDYFRDQFRQCKQLNASEIDLQNFNNQTFKLHKADQPTSVKEICARRCLSLGLKPTSSWKVTALAGYAGFYLIQNSLHDLAKWFWILRALVDFTQYPIKSNLTSEAALSSHRFPWKHYDPHFRKTKSSNEKKQPIERLRWTTLGLFHSEFLDKVRIISILLSQWKSGRFMRRLNLFN